MNMLAKIKFESQNLDKDIFEALKTFVGEDEDSFNTYGVKVNDETGSEETYYSWNNKEIDAPWRISETRMHLSSSNPMVVDIVKLGAVLPNIKYSVVKLYNDSMIGQMNTIEASLNKMITALSSFDKDIEFNNRCEVHVPNLGLLSVNETMLLEDSCTDSLQSFLDKGWRIISIAPQPNQRRPDYILGRFNPDRQPDGTARRG